jgi:hypothetical protein
MPRRDEPFDLPDDDDDRPRRRPARDDGSLGAQLRSRVGGIPVWAWLGGAVAGAAALAALSVVLTLVAATAERRGAAGRAELVDAADLHADYKADGAAAAQKYAGRLLRVRLRVDSTRQHGDELEVRQDFGFLSCVEADIPLREAGRASKGSVITVVGRVQSSGSVVRLGDCEVEAPAP